MSFFKRYLYYKWKKVIQIKKRGDNMKQMKKKYMSPNILYIKIANRCILCSSQEKVLVHDEEIIDQW